MPTSLFTASMEQITADDVHTFLDEELEEGPRLDYKQADPNHLIPQDVVDVICAFANTYGGLLILGVKADQTTNRPIERKGLPLVKDSKPVTNLEERITSKCFDSIVPPLAPEVRVCPFKSDPTLAVDDQAFMVIRVPPSPAAPHAVIKKDPRVLVRVGSECRNADLMTLRFLFERQQQREGMIERTRASVWKGHLSTRKGFENSEGGSWKPPGPDRIYVDFIPLDASTDLLPFESTLSDGGFLDEHIRSKLSSLAWLGGQGGSMMKWLGDLLPLQRGLGILSRWHGPRIDIVPASAMYFDRSGGMAIDLVASGFSYSQDQQVSEGRDHRALLLWMTIVQISDLVCGLLRERNYSGRIAASVWATAHLDEIALDIQDREHYGETAFSLLDPKPERSEKLGLMMNRMVRTWLHFKMPVQGWVEKYSNEFIQERSL